MVAACCGKDARTNELFKFPLRHSAQPNDLGSPTVTRLTTNYVMKLEAAECV